MHTNHHSLTVDQSTQTTTQSENLNSQNDHLPCCVKIEKADMPRKSVYGHTVADVEKQILDWLKDTKNSDEVNATNHAM